MIDKLKILHIEDSEDDSFLIERELKKGNYIPEITRVETPEELVTQLTGKTWDIVISDFLLPVFNGINALQIFKEFDLDIPFLIVSGRIGEETAVEVMRAGAQDYIMKDNLRRLVPAVQRELREAAIRKDRKQTKASLKRSESRYQSIFEATATALLIISKDFIILHANREFSRLSGYGIQEIKGVLSLTNFIPDDEIPPLPKNIESGVRVETRLLCKNGTSKNVILTGAAISYDGSFIISILDITDRKKMEGRLKNSEEKFFRIFQGSPFPIFICDQQGDTIIDANQAYRDLLGFHNDNTNELNFNETNDSLKDMIKDLFEGKKVANRESEMIRSNGDPLLVYWSLEKIEIGGQAYILAIGRDATELRKYEKKLRQAQKLESIGTLAGGIAHDFNNILAVIIGYTEMLLTKNEETDPSYRYLKEIYKAGNRARNLVKQILTFSRDTEGEKTPVCISAILKETLDLIRATLPSTIEIKSSILSNSFILSDPTRLHQVFMNLATNSFHAMKRGGMLTVDARDVIIDPSVFPGTNMKTGRYTKVCISDNGHGIEPAVLDRIFEPFYTTKDVNEGTGLGLSVVHGIIQSLGGDISVESTPGIGTAFTIFLPVHDIHATSDSEEKFNGGEAGSGHIMCVDDEKPMADLLEAVLTDLGYTISCFTNSLQALDSFENNPKKYDLVLTDHTMPKLTGLEMAKKFLSIRKDIPIILQTGYSDAVEREGVLKLGIADFIMKPVHKDELAGKIRLLLDREKEVSRRA